MLVEMLEQKKVLQKIPVMVMSFSWSAIEKLQRLNPALSSTLLLYKFTPWFQVKYSSAASFERLNNNSNTILVGSTVSTCSVAARDAVEQQPLRTKNAPRVRCAARRPR
jgi:hypothetical protein